MIKKFIPIILIAILYDFRINPLSLVEIIAHIVQQYTDKKQAVAFLEKVEAKVKMNDEALALCKVSTVYIFVSIKKYANLHFKI